MAVSNGGVRPIAFATRQVLGAAASYVVTVNAIVNANATRTSTERWEQTGNGGTNWDMVRQTEGAGTDVYAPAMVAASANATRLTSGSGATVSICGVYYP